MAKCLASILEHGEHLDLLLSWIYLIIKPFGLFENIQDKKNSQFQLIALI